MAWFHDLFRDEETFFKIMNEHDLIDIYEAHTDEEPMSRTTLDVTVYRFKEPICVEHFPTCGELFLKPSIYEKQRDSWHQILVGRQHSEY